MYMCLRRWRKGERERERERERGEGDKCRVRERREGDTWGTAKLTMYIVHTFEI